MKGRRFGSARLPARLAWTIGAVALGCAPTTSASHAPEPRGGAPEASPTLAGDDPLVASPSESWRSPRTPLELLLPDAARWHERREPGRFLVLEHAPTSSVLAVQAWYTEERMDRRSCERLARGLRDLPTIPPAAVEETVPIPEGFDTSVQLDVMTSSDGAVVDGALLAIGARGKQCFAYLFGTRATGAGAERRVADRLAAMRTRSLSRVRLERDTDPVPRAPHPALGRQGR